MQELLLERVASLSSSALGIFISYGSNPSFTKNLLDARPDIWKRLTYFNAPLNDDSDVDLLITLHRQKLLPEELRLKFVETVRSTVIRGRRKPAGKFRFRGVLTDAEMQDVLEDIKTEVLEKLDKHVERVRKTWDKNYSPEDHFDQFTNNIELFAKTILSKPEVDNVKSAVRDSIRTAVWAMEEEYEPSKGVSAAPTQQSVTKAGLAGRAIPRRRQLRVSR